MGIRKLAVALVLLIPAPGAAGSVGQSIDLVSYYADARVSALLGTSVKAEKKELAALLRVVEYATIFNSGPWGLGKAERKYAAKAMAALEKAATPDEDLRDAARDVLDEMRAYTEYVVSDVQAALAGLPEKVRRKAAGLLAKVPAACDAADGRRLRQEWGKAFAAEGKAHDLAMKASDLVYE